MMDECMRAASHKLTRLKLAAAACSLALASTAAGAQGYPERAVTFVVPYTAGSQTDSVARLIAQALQERLGQPFLIENKAGGGGLLAALLRGPAVAGRQWRGQAV
jgi:tripartite-type tricarboxylate transporter receptor subunit TctC